MIAGWSIAIAPRKGWTGWRVRKAPSCCVRSGSPKRSRWLIRLTARGRSSSARPASQ